MTRLIGFLLGVCVTLVGIYWFMYSDGVPPSSAEALRPLATSVPLTPVSEDTVTPDAGLSGHVQRYPAPATSGLGEATSVQDETLSEAMPLPGAEADQRSSGDRADQSWAPQETADAEPIAAAARPATDAPAPEPSGQAAPSAPAEVATPDLQVSDESPVEESAPEDSLRFVFWSPFRSERAARGFAERLSLATAVRVDVERLAPGRYRVAFDYRDEAERRALLDRIEQITGLQLSGDPLP